MPEIRSETGRFLPGASGNPGGRSKDLFRVRDMIAARGPEIVDALLAIALPKKIEPDADGILPAPRKTADRIKAIDLLLAYWVGRPSGGGGQEQEQDAPQTDLHKLSGDQLRRIREIMLEGAQ